MICVMEFGIFGFKWGLKSVLTCFNGRLKMVALWISGICIFGYIGKGYFLYFSFCDVRFRDFRIFVGMSVMVALWRKSPDLCYLGEVEKAFSTIFSTYFQHPFHIFSTSFPQKMLKNPPCKNMPQTQL